MQSLIAIVLGNLPVRYWSALEEQFPVYRMAWLSGTMTMFGGIAIGITTFLPYASEVTTRTSQAFIEAHGDLGLLPGAGMAVLPMFLLTTPAGLLSLYLTASGFLRAAGAFLADDPRGDFILTGIDTAFRRRVARTRAARRSADRERSEGAAVPDRLVRGDQIGRPDSAACCLRRARRPIGHLAPISWGATALHIGSAPPSTSSPPQGSARRIR